MLYFVDSSKGLRAEKDKNLVSDIFLIPDDFSLIESDYGQSENYPPRLIEFIYHDLGDMENKDYCSAVLRDERCDNNGDNQEYVQWEVRLPDDVSNDIIGLANGDFNLYILDKMASMFSSVKEDDSIPTAGKIQRAKLPEVINERNMQLKKSVVLEGKNYTLYFIDSEKVTRAQKNIVSDIFLIPDDYSYITKDGASMNYPPRALQFIDSFYGTSLSVVLEEKRCDVNCDNRETVRRVVYLPDDVADTIRALYNEKTQLRPLYKSMYGEDTGSIHIW